MRRLVFPMIFLALVLASALAAPAAHAEAKLGIKGIGAHLDYVDPEGLDGVIGVGGLVELGTIAPRVHLEGNVDIWSKSNTVFSVKTTIRDIAFGGTVTYYFLGEADSPVQYYAGGGLALHMVHAKVSGSYYVPEYYPYSTEASNTDTKLGIDLAGGARYALSGPFQVLGELRYRLVSDTNQFELRGGLVYKLGK